MSQSSEGGPGRAVARIGWVVLVVLTAGYAINHVAGIATFSDTDDERLMFAVFAGLNALTLIILLLPYRQRQFWAWAATWVSVAVFALCPIWVAPPIGLFYLGTAVVLALAQLATLPDFTRAAKRGGAPDR
ncbi:hypothetical protein [Microlunatus parietis]|uniref:Uncharacterized protein n=1 Tax=Microlunatus parietis TaxID=682979 RepID=A0A7Y9LB30_9ACTN|nr:hypothetical protein [Microlunatus parietis]NYE73454.1 hypothetical protein [Microlunatus parietis]